MRTEVERLNGRIDRDYMFNDHFIRGLKKMNLMLSLTFVVMLTMAKGHIKNKQKNIRSLVAQKMIMNKKVQICNRDILRFLHGKKCKLQIF